MIFSAWECSTGPHTFSWPSWDSGGCCPSSSPGPGDHDDVTMSRSNVSPSPRDRGPHRGAESSPPACQSPHSDWPDWPDHSDPRHQSPVPAGDCDQVISDVQHLSLLLVLADLVTARHVTLHPSVWSVSEFWTEMILELIINTRALFTLLRPVHLMAIVPVLASSQSTSG